MNAEPRAAWGPGGWWGLSTGSCDRNSSLSDAEKNPFAESSGRRRQHEQTQAQRV